MTVLSLTLRQEARSSAALGEQAEMAVVETRQTPKPSPSKEESTDEEGEPDSNVDKELGASPSRDNSSIFRSSSFSASGNLSASFADFFNPFTAFRSARRFSWSPGGLGVRNEGQVTVFGPARPEIQSENRQTVEAPITTAEGSTTPEDVQPAGTIEVPAERAGVQPIEPDFLAITESKSVPEDQGLVVTTKTQSGLVNLVSKFLSQFSTAFAHRSFRLGKMFSMKDRLPFARHEVEKQLADVQD